MKYALDLDTNTVHREDCDLLGVNKVIWKTLVVRWIEERRKKVCPVCARKEYRELKRTENEKNIANGAYTFIVVEGRGIFHRNTCGLVLSSARLRGFSTYKNAQKNGRCPCKMCQPTSDEKILQKGKGNRRIPTEFYGLKQEEVRAIKRYREAKSELERNKDVQGADLCELTQTSFAFWVSKGYKNFHLRNCPKLNLTNLKGFGKYEQAIKSGYTPCKQCKPTKKQNVEFSILLNSRKIEDESVDALKILCDKHGYTYQLDNEFFCLETPKGKWKIHIKTNPIRLEHINFLYKSKNYHRQPKLFLSLHDAFRYIQRHDKGK